MSVSIICGKIIPQLILTAIVKENYKNIHNKSLSFFLDKTMDVQNQNFDLIFTKHINNKVTDKDFSSVYKLTFQSNKGIDSEFNIDQKDK